MATPTPFLAGTKVLELSIWRPGPYAVSLLVSLGADVLKVEPPGGDPMRHYGGLFGEINAGKRSVVLDLKAGPDLARAHELAAQADVLVEGFRPGVLARFGLDEPVVRARNPGLVYCSISGYGQDDPRASLPGHDVNYQAWAGTLTPEGGPGVMPRLPTADLASGVTAAFGICAALLGRAQSGVGACLDISMTDVLSTWTGRTGTGEGDVGTDPATVPGYGLFDTVEGRQVSLGVVNEQHFWAALCRQLGLEDEAGLDFAERMARGTELQRALATRMEAWRRDELVAALAGAGVPVAPVLTRAEMVAAAPFPAFPIRLGPPGETGPVPGVDEHRGQGFADST